ncbi:type VII secretion-associated serine protease mycosin [Salinispora vitiensis]|uniref:type VII secretion-associated serine protease mycosin n=1 Tax=Salinispora vitiensis TaxID=999544 RepID=UPI00036509A6|nr:type VII secretion-associated serine protease mycosin [Salinispora vitiensis]
MRLARPTTTITAALTAIMALGIPAPAAAADRNDAWYLDALEITEIHKITQGEGITVAVIDSGVDVTHPDLKNNVLPGTDIYDNQSKGHTDRTGHGTGIASLIAGHGHGPNGRDGVLGIAPKAKILPITVANRGTGGRTVVDASEIPAAIDWAVDQGADVINVSLDSSPDKTLDQAVERAYQYNVVVVAAIGNRENAVISPLARHDATLAVAGLDRDGQPSSIGSVKAQEIHLAAPAEDLYIALPGGRYTTANGNSGATAVASGAVALVKSKYPNISSQDLFKRMIETTRDAGEPGRDPEYGWGTLDLRAALTGEPDGRTTQTQTPTPEPTLDPILDRARNSEQPSNNNLQPILITTIIVAILGLATTTALLLLRRRRRAATTPTTHTTLQTPTTTPPNPTDHTDWQRPN